MPDAAPGAIGSPIAVVGMACRFPGAPDVSAFWRLLEDGASAVTEGVPGSGVGRVGELFSDAATQNDACRFGAFIDGIDQFDAAFFRISPVEAQLLDPQQRLMLEVSWQALEDAGIDPDRLRGSRTGVYAGISNNEYRALVLDGNDTAEPATSLYSVAGTSFNTAIGRVAFALGLQGPALAVDTACSSSLAAVHQAVSGLQRGEADLALAGGVHAILSGRLFELRGNAGMLAPDGRCKTFDAAADGYVRGEGCGILVLKRLSDAEADGDRIWGVVRSTALNQDGASPGLTVPSGEAQQRVIADALAWAGVQPPEVDYVEAHGTGTPVGDPIEAEATGTAYSVGRDPDRPLLIGSVKTNVGHLESAAGAAALIKVMLAMRRGVIPKHLNFQNPNPEIGWDRLPLQVTSEPTRWPRRGDGPPLAGVSGFGWSGTNAHVVVEGYGAPVPAAEGSDPRRWVAGPPRPVVVSGPAQAAASPPAAARSARLLPLSGKTAQALTDLAGGYLVWLDEQAQTDLQDPVAGGLLPDMAWTAGVGRSHFSHRAAVVFSDRASLRESLEVVAGGEDQQPSTAATRLAFAYTGQASQWVGMGRALYDREPVFRAVLDRCDEVLQQERGASLLDVMSGSEDELDDPAWTQPCIYAIECALTALWAGIGVRPDVVVGHSLGEIAAARAAGAFSLEDGLRFAAARGALMGALGEDGAMAAIFATPERVAAAVDELNASTGGSPVSVAADNGMHQVISGPADAIDSLLERFEAGKAWVRRLRKSPAYHSALVEPALDDLDAVVDGIETAMPSVTYVSSMTGQVLEAGTLLDGRYWRSQARAPVAFRTCVETLAGMGVDAVIEIGPDTVLGPTVATAWPQGAGPAQPVIASSMRRPSAGKPDPADGSGFLDAVAAVYRAGIDVSFEGLFAGEARRRVALPGYRFQHHRYWVEPPRRRRQASDHGLLGTRHDSPRGETLYATEMNTGDPAWLDDHRVYGRVITPGALYGSMAVAACSSSSRWGELVVEDFQLHSPMVFDEHDPADAADAAGRSVQLALDGSDENSPRQFEVFSRSGTEDGWTLHAQGMVSSSTGGPTSPQRPDLEQLRAGLDAVDTADFYRARAGAGVDLGGSFRTLASLWARDGEALGEVALPDGIAGGGAELHPLLLDGCFQVMAAARRASGGEDSTPYLPFGWERLRLHGPLPDRLLCHARLREPGGAGAGAEATGPREVIAADLCFYASDGTELGRLDGYTVKRATRAALLSATESLDDLLYEVVWRDRPLPPGVVAADFLAGPAAVAERSDTFAAYLEAAGVDKTSRAELLDDLERLSRSYALMTLERLGWQRTAGESVDPDALRERLGVLPEHGRLFRRLFELLARAGVVEASGDTFVVASGPEDPGNRTLPADPEAFGAEMADRYEHGSTEIGLFLRSAGALADVLVGEADPLTLLFSSGEPTAADLYLKAPVARAANQLLADTVATLLEQLPDGRRLRVIEVGAGTGSATAAVLPELPEGRFDYTYTDISAGFFAEAEGRFGGPEASIDYRVLDIEHDPGSQGFDYHAYDLVIASNVLHATRYLSETLEHCRDLLAPSGHLVALENLRGQGWLDLTFGQLDGWWRFADSCRPHHALASPAVWRQALDGAGFEGVEILGADETDPDAEPDRGVILAQGPADVAERPGVWVLAADRGGAAADLAGRLATLNQTVVLAGDAPSPDPAPLPDGVVPAVIDMESRADWQALLGTLPSGLPLNGVVHLAAADAHAGSAGTEQMATAVRRAAASALALMQGLADADATTAKGVWFVTRGGQVLEHESAEGVAGAVLWGFGKVAAREASHLQPRMIDLDPAAPELPPGISDEFLHPDPETHIAYRGGHRQAARLVRAGSTERLSLPEPAGESGWLLEPDEGGALEGLRVEAAPSRSLEPGEVRVAVEATGLNFWDMFRSLGVIDEGLLGGEFCGRVLEVGPGVSTVQEGDRVVGLAFGTFSAEAVTCEEMVAPAPPNIGVTALATMPTAFVSAALSFDLAELQAGERVLIHAAAGGVGLAAVQLAQAAGAEVFATASAPKQAYLRSLGVEHVFDSRSTSFGEQILEATSGEGVDVVLNSLTGPGFIDTSLSCLARGGRFVELARVDILTPDEMSQARPDVGYWILELDVLKEHDPAQAGDALKRVMQRLAAGELAPLAHTRWSLAEVGAGMKFMRAARHIGKIVFAASPLETGSLRADRTYLVTGGLGGIGCTVAGWLFDRGAGAIVLNGRRDPDPEAAEAIAELRERGATVSVELADMTDAAAVDAMLARVSETLPPLAGVIHSVGVLSDAALTNQSWESFERVLWPKVLGAWHLHRATADRDLDMFVLFSSVAGVLGNPGQANHAAANAFLDVLAAHRRSLGLAGQSIAWGAWSGLGEAEEQRERIAAQLEAAGTGWITPQHGLKAFDHLVRQDPTAPMVASVDWQMVADDHESRSPVLEDLLAAVTSGAGSRQDSQTDLLSELGASPATEHEQILAGFLQRELQAVMRLRDLPASSVEFADLGMDSLMAVELRNRLNRGLAGAYTAGNTVVFDYPSVQSLAAYLAAELAASGGIAAPEGAGDARFAVQIPAVTSSAEPDQGPVQPDQEQAGPAERAAAQEPAAQVVPSSPPVDNGIAIVGMACRFPGAPDLDSFWRQLEAGENAVTDGRRDSGPWNGAAGDPANPDPASRVGAYVEGIDQFDAGFFGIRPIEARMMDPQQRMLLETTWQSLEDAAIDPVSLKGSRTGVYAGIGGSSEYRRVIAAAGRGDSYFGTTSSVAVGRIAFTLGLAGPAVPFDLACASSLVAVHHAVSALHAGEVDLALAGGANAVLSPSITKFLAETQMLSSSGQCRAFDAAADGYIRGEGCGMVALKRLEDAIADGDRIWAVVRGTAVNQNATGLGLTQPNGPAQMQAMEQALARAVRVPADVDYLEAHGPGSPFGDAVEMNAAATVYGAGREDGRPLLVGSVKTNIAHLECASAVAGLIKTVLAMDRGRIPEHLHLSEPSKQIDWERLPVRVTTEATDWPATPGRPRLAAVNSFAISGANAHLVVEGHDAGSGEADAAGADVRSHPERRTRMLPLSAQSDEALRELAARFGSWLDEQASELTDPGGSSEALLGDLAWTASVGRTHFTERAAVVFDDFESLREGLQAVADGRQAPRAVGSPGGRDAALDAAADYEAGLDVPFHELFSDEIRHRISVPGYPFERRRHWVQPLQPK